MCTYSLLLGEVSDLGWGDGAGKIWGRYVFGDATGSRGAELGRSGGELVCLEGGCLVQGG